MLRAARQRYEPNHEAKNALLARIRAHEQRPPSPDVPVDIEAAEPPESLPKRSAWLATPEVIPSLRQAILQLTCRVAVLLLGKRLINGTLTREGRSRCDCLVGLIHDGTIPPDAVIVCSGHRGEAVAMQSYLINRLGDVEHWSNQIILETEARFSRDNIELSMRRLEELQKRFDVVYCISSDYHVQRVEAVDILAPSVSDLRPLRQKYPWKPVTLLGAPYPFARHPSESVRWLASIYCLTHWFAPLEATLYGLQPADGQSEPHIKTIRVETVKLVKMALEHLARLEQKVPLPTDGSNSQVAAAVERVAANFRRHLNALSELVRRMEQAFNGRLEIRAEYEEWDDCLVELRKAKADLQWAADPDYHVN